MNRPKIICLCGSTKFKDEYLAVQKKLTLDGIIVLSVGFFGHVDGDPTKEQKAMVDELHKRKIDLADEIFVINVGGYIGTSTRSAIEYAEEHSKLVQYLEPKV